jgi:hypothetical protein
MKPARLLAILFTILVGANLAAIGPTRGQAVTRARLTLSRGGKDVFESGHFSNGLTSKFSLALISPAADLAWVEAWWGSINGRCAILCSVCIRKVPSGRASGY